MKRRLIVMRHAKSSWKSEARTDHGRPLNERGRRDAPKVARRLVELGWEPERVLSSDSARTRETFERMVERFESKPRAHFRRSLYHAGIEKLRQEVSTLPEELRCVLVLGHNPGWDEAVHWLCGKAVELKTANAALLTLSAKSWKQATTREGAWTLKDVIRSREL